MAENKLGLNPKDFKHIKSDNKSTTLQHRNGHLLTIAHDTLSPKNRSILQALSKTAQQSATPVQAQEEQAQNRYNMSKGGPVEQMTPTAGTMPQMADGGVAFGDPNTGGRVPIPDGPAPQPIAPAEELAPATQKPIPISTWEQVKNNWWDPENKKAEGGKIEAMQSQHGGDGNVCKYCGGSMVHKYAEGDQVEQGPQAGVTAPADIGGVQQVVPRQASVPTEQVDTQKLYNSIVQGRGGAQATPSEEMFNPNAMTYATFGPNGEPPKSFDSSAWQQAETMLQQQQAAAAGAGQERTAQIQSDNVVRQRAGLAPEPVPGSQPQWQPAPTTMAQPQSMQTPATTSGDVKQPDQTQQPTNQLSNDPETLLKTGAQQAMAGIQQEATARGGLGEQQAAAIAQNLDAQRQAQVTYKQHFDELEAERQNHMQDIKDGYIDPDQYWKGDANGNGGHSKVMAGIGMILAGFNPTNNPNAAINFLKYQMDRNMDAQKTNLAEKNNMLYANLQQFHNLRDATDMTRAMQTDIMANELQKAAATAANPLAKAAALQAAGKLQMDLAPQMQVFAMRRAMQSLAGGGPQGEGTYNQLLGYMRTVNPEYAKELEGRMVPGVGVSQSQQVPQDVRQQLVAKQDLDMLAKDLLQYSSTHTNIIPGTPEYNTGAAKAFNLKQKYREAQLGGILRQGEMPLLDKVLAANPAGVFKELSSIPKLKEMINLNDMSKNMILKNYGIVPWGGPTSPETAPQGQIVKRKDGTSWRKVPGGYVPAK